MVSSTPRVLMVLFQFPPVLGGAEVQAARLAGMLRQRNVDVGVVTARFRGLSAFDQWNGVPVHRILCPTDYVRPSRLGIYTFMFSLAVFLATHGREYEIIHAHQAMFAAALAIPLGRLLRKRTIVKFGGTGSNGDFANLRKLRFGAQMVKSIQQVDIAIATSTAIRRDLERDGFAASRIVSIPNGIDTRDLAPVFPKAELRAKLGIPCEARVALFVGNLRAVKGIDVLLNAWQRVRAQCPNAYLLIVGDGILRSGLENQAVRLGIANSVTFVGAHADPRNFYWAADVFVLPSRTEGFPNVILEALAASLPCVASNVGGILDQIETGRNGLLVPPENPDAFADALVQLLRDRGLARAMGESARETARRFDWDVIAPQYIALYRHLLEQTG